ncbi:hypothetical protein JHW43_008070 [Diplocarpon mali]|nr:hypothetical protein JHW43_008070 [Diplocarpon mali]
MAHLDRTQKYQRTPCWTRPPESGATESLTTTHLSTPTPAAAVSHPSSCEKCRDLPQSELAQTKVEHLGALDPRFYEYGEDENDLHEARGLDSNSDEEESSDYSNQHFDKEHFALADLEKARQFYSISGTLPTGQISSFVRHHPKLKLNMRADVILHGLGPLGSGFVPLRMRIYQMCEQIVWEDEPEEFNESDSVSEDMDQSDDEVELGSDNPHESSLDDATPGLGSLQLDDDDEALFRGALLAPEHCISRRESTEPELVIST